MAYAELFLERTQPVLQRADHIVVMPEECQSMPMTAPNDWNQNKRAYAEVAGLR